MRKTLEADIGWDDDFDSEDEEETAYVGPDGTRDVYHMGGSQRLAVGEDGACKSLIETDFYCRALGSDLPYREWFEGTNDHFIALRCDRDADSL